MMNDTQPEKSFVMGIATKQNQDRKEQSNSGERHSSETLNGSQVESLLAGPTAAIIKRQSSAALNGSQVNKTDSMKLLTASEIEDFQSRWHTVQMEFVDGPRLAVDEADTLTTELIEHISGVFTKRQNQLKDQWLHSDDLSTEDLRIALQHYRAFFNKLLSTT